MAIQDLVNYTVKNLPDVLTPVLDQVILAANCDPLHLRQSLSQKALELLGHK